ncbi:MAG: Co2+/Mg2+ efflux protein ApaG [Methylococcales bacterium]|nr:Co2+/Mg2+ efflux protein ApaG [Methylococcales bacterium]
MSNSSFIIEPQPQYIEAQSNPGQNHFVFAYTITITNNGRTGAQLLSRHWLITDAEGKTQEVRGDGVVGEQPYLAPGASFRYTSGAILPTAVGVMQGYYTFQTDDGQRFQATIPRFTLSIPRTLH